MVMFIERGIHSASVNYGRYAQANNKYMRSYNSSKLSSYLMYYDMNNLYRWAMYQPLPYAEFRRIEDAANINAIVPDSPTVTFSKLISSIRSIYTTDTLTYLLSNAR